jgi:UDP-N-acetylmuramoylalanine--D-glutamate ligase
VEPAFAGQAVSVTGMGPAGPVGMVPVTAGSDAMTADRMPVAPGATAGPSTAVRPGLGGSPTAVTPGPVGLAAATAGATLVGANRTGGQPEPIGPASFTGRRVLVAGTGVAGAASARALLRLGARVTVIDRRDSAVAMQLRDAGATVVVAEEPRPELFEDSDEMVVSPGIPPYSLLVVLAREVGLPIYSEPELAWRLRGPHAPAWLAVTGTNGKTTTTTMLASILHAAGLRAAALGNIGEPLVDAAVDSSRFDVLAVELSSFQLHWSSQLAPQAGALLNLADDHLDWHGTFEAYASSKTAIWRSATNGGGVAIGNLDDPRVAHALAQVSGRTVGVTLGEPSPGQVGVLGGVLIDHAFGRSALRLGPSTGIRPAGSHNVCDALHAAALARAFGVPAAAVTDGLASYVPEPHRNAFVASLHGVTYVDDSKATNPHAAYASLVAYPRIVWIAGGQLKGVEVDDLVAAVADRLVGVVLLGEDRARIADALARHAPHLPVVEVDGIDDGAMRDVVRAAAGMACPGDTVLLAPAAASLDMFRSYAHRGDAFAAAVEAVGATRYRSHLPDDR